MTENRTRLDAIEARAAAATPGPWEVYRESVCQSDAPPPDDPAVLGHYFSADLYGLNRPPDAAFIAAARTDLPLLLAVLRRVEGLADAWDAEARQAMANGLDAQAIAQDWCVNDLRRVIAPLLEPEPSA